MKKPSSAPAAAVAYVRFVMDELQLSASALAKGAGLATTTLTRALNDPDHRFELSMTTLKKLAAFSGISPAPFLQATDFADLSLVPFTQPNLYDETWGEGANAKPDDDIDLILIIGRAEYGVFRAPEIRPIEESGPISIKIGDLKSTEVFALEMADESASVVIPRGFFALCKRSTDFDHGDMVVVEQWTADRRVMEYTVRRLVIPESGPPYLRMDSRDERFDELLQLPDDITSNPLVRPTGKVLWAINSVRDEALELERRVRILARRKAAAKAGEA